MLKNSWKENNKWRNERIKWMERVWMDGRMDRRTDELYNVPLRRHQTHQGSLQGQSTQPIVDKTCDLPEHTLSQHPTRGKKVVHYISLILLTKKIQSCDTHENSPIPLRPLTRTHRSCYDHFQKLNDPFMTPHENSLLPLRPHTGNSP